MPDETRDQVSLLKLFAFLLRWRRFILASSLSVAIVVAIISFLLPPQYKSTAIVRTQKGGESGIGSLLSSKLGGLAGLGSLAGMGNLLGESPEEVTLSILQSRWICERVIDKFDLRTVYKAKDSPIEDVIKTLLEHTQYNIDDGSNNIVIEVEDRSAKRAKEMADYLVEQLDLRNQELRSQKAKQEREFIGQRLGEERSKLTLKEDSLFQFQMESGMLNVEEQTKATIQAAAALEAERLKTQTKLEMLRKIYGTAGSETQYTQLQLSSIDSTLQSLIRTNTSGKHDFLLPMEDIPAKGLIYLRLMRDIEIQQLLVGFLLQQFEQSKIEEQRNTPTLTRLDPPVEATRRSWPKRSVMVLIAFSVTFIFSSVMVFLIEYLGNAARDPQHPQYAHIASIRQAWIKKR